MERGYIGGGNIKSEEEAVPPPPPVLFQCLPSAPSPLGRYPVMHQKDYRALHELYIYGMYFYHAGFFSLTKRRAVI